MRKPVYWLAATCSLALVAAFSARPSSPTPVARPALREPAGVQRAIAPEPEVAAEQASERPFHAVSDDLRTGNTTRLSANAAPRPAFPGKIQHADQALQPDATASAELGTLPGGTTTAPFSAIPLYRDPDAVARLRAGVLPAEGWRRLRKLTPGEELTLTPADAGPGIVDRLVEPFIYRNGPTTIMPTIVEGTPAVRANVQF